MSVKSEGSVLLPSTLNSASQPASGASSTPRTASSSTSDVISSQVFSGASTEDATAWLAYFLRYTRFKRYADDDVVRMFPLFLRGTAADWYEQLTDAVRSDFAGLQQVFKERFNPFDFTRWVKVSGLFSRVQGTNESVDEFVVQMQKLAKAVDITDDTMIRYAVLKGLKALFGRMYCNRMLKPLPMFCQWSVL